MSGKGSPMKRVVSSLSLVLFAAATALRAQNTMTAEVTAAYKGVSTNILKAAEKMPDADSRKKAAQPEPSQLCRDFDVIDRRMWLRYLLAHFAHGFEVCGQGILKVSARLFFGTARRDTPGNIRRIRGITRPRLFDDHRIAFCAHFSPAFLSIAFNVPGARAGKNAEAGRTDHRLSWSVTSR